MEIRDSSLNQRVEIIPSGDPLGSACISINLLFFLFFVFFNQVKALKEKIEAERGKDNFPVSGQKLIYAGKILQDDTPIKDYKIDEKNFVVVMVSKVRSSRNT